MHEREDRPPLQLLSGGASGSSRRRSSLLVVEDRQRAAPVQLGLPCVAARRRTLVCTTVQAMTELGPRHWLRELAPSTVVDLRIAPSFRRLHLRGREFAELVDSHGARYLHLARLANRHVGSACHEERYRRLLEQHFADNEDAVAQLREMIAEGPVLLIAAGRSRFELGLLLAALDPAGSGFEVQLCLGE